MRWEIQAEYFAGCVWMAEMLIFRGNLPAIAAEGAGRVLAIQDAGKTIQAEGMWCRLREAAGTRFLTTS